MTAVAAEAWRVAWAVQRLSSPASGAATSWPTAVVAAGTAEAAGTCPGPAAVVPDLVPRLVAALLSQRAHSWSSCQCSWRAAATVASAS